MKRLAALAPGLDMFRSSFVLRDARGWQITDAGRAFLTLLEAAKVPVLALPETTPVTKATQQPAPVPEPLIAPDTRQSRSLRVVSRNGRLVA